MFGVVAVAATRVRLEVHCRPWSAHGRPALARLKVPSAPRRRDAASSWSSGSSLAMLLVLSTGL